MPLSDQMGGYFSKIGSDPYYANYERSFQRLRKDIDSLSVSLMLSCSVASPALTVLETH